MLRLSILFIIDSYGLESDFIELVYNGVDTDEFYPIQKEIKEIVAFIGAGTLYHIKNHEFLINAFSMLHKLLSNANLIIVENGELKDALLSQIPALGLDKAVELVGNQEN